MNCARRSARGFLCLLLIWCGACADQGTARTGEGRVEGARSAAQEDSAGESAIVLDSAAQQAIGNELGHVAWVSGRRRRDINSSGVDETIKLGFWQRMSLRGVSRTKGQSGAARRRSDDPSGRLPVRLRAC